MDYYKTNEEIRNQIRNGLERLENEIFYFYGVFDRFFKIDDMILEVIEDPDDGYRSMLGAVCHCNDLKISHNFFEKPLGKVILKQFEDDTHDVFYGWILEDIQTNHNWVTFGTANADDYYPMFVFNYDPDKNQKKFINVDKDYIPFKERHPELLLKYPSWFDGTRFDYGEF